MHYGCGLLSVVQNTNLFGKLIGCVCMTLVLGSWFLALGFGLRVLRS